VNGMLTNAALPWHAIEMEDPALNKEEDVQGALAEANEVMSLQYHNSKFYTNIDGVYEEVLGFGEGCLFIGEGKKTPLNFQPFPLRGVYTDEDSEGDVDTLFRCFEMTARRAIQKWGKDKLHDQMKQSLDAADAADKTWEIVHVVYPRTDREINEKTAAYKKDALNKPFLSAYIDTKNKHLIDEGGYDEFPYAVPRLFIMADDGYGRGLGWNALADTKMLNTMEKYGIRGWQKAVDPPTVGPDEGMSMPLKVGPGAHNYNSNWDKPGSEVKPLYGAGHSTMLPNYEQKCEQKREQIRNFFFYKQFRTQQEGQPRTAQEIIQIASENLKILGPLLHRLQEELLKPIITRSFGILFRKGMFPKLKALLDQKRIPNAFKIVYLSPIAKAQRLYEAQELQNAFSLLLPIAQVSPEMLDNIDVDKAYDEVASLYPALRKISRTDEEVQGIRDERQKKIADEQAKLDTERLIAGAEIASKTDPNAGLLPALSGNIGAAA
ncbi:MAG: portal protein, partial [Candidatus Omnitrophica bacterium]|nr:portal protein [Candidatus Omnitrophota bacterium]